MNKDIANLRAVAVSNDDFIFAGEFSNGFAYFNSNFFLSFGSSFAIFLQSIATEG